MSEPEAIKAEVVSTSILNPDDRVLLDEVTDLRINSLSNMRDAFRQLITLSSTILTLQIAILGLFKYSFAHPIGLHEAFILISLASFFISASISVIGQFSNRIDLSTINTLETYRRYRDKVLSNGHRLYVLASLFFIVGLACFLISSVLVLLQ